MDEQSLIDDIISLLRGRGYDVEESEGEWPIIVGSGDYPIGITVVAIESAE